MPLIPPIKGTRIDIRQPGISSGNTFIPRYPKKEVQVTYPEKEPRKTPLFVDKLSPIASMYGIFTYIWLMFWYMDGMGLAFVFLFFSKKILLGYQKTHRTDELNLYRETKSSLLCLDVAYIFPSKSIISDQLSGQIIATSHDLTPNGGFRSGNPFISGKCGLVKY